MKALFTLLPLLLGGQMIFNLSVQAEQCSPREKLLNDFINDLLIKKFDKNGDGKVDKNEESSIDPFATQELLEVVSAINKKFDYNRNGKIDVNEKPSLEELKEFYKELLRTQHDDSGGQDMIKQLDLTTDQKEALAKYTKENKEKGTEARKLKGEERKAAMKKIAEARNAKLKEILTGEQAEKLKELQAQALPVQAQQPKEKNWFQDAKWSSKIYEGRLNIKGKKNGYEISYQKFTKSPYAGEEKLMLIRSRFKDEHNYVVTVNGRADRRTLHGYYLAGLNKMIKVIDEAKILWAKDKKRGELLEGYEGRSRKFDLFKTEYVSEARIEEYTADYYSSKDKDSGKLRWSLTFNTRISSPFSGYEGSNDIYLNEDKELEEFSNILHSMKDLDFFRKKHENVAKILKETE